MAGPYTPTTPWMAAFIESRDALVLARDMASDDPLEHLAAWVRARSLCRDLRARHDEAPEVDDRWGVLRTERVCEKVIARIEAFVGVDAGP